MAEHGDLVGADLVHYVAVGRDAIRAEHHDVDLAAPHVEARRRVGNDVVGDAELLAFPSAEPCPLQARARFVQQDVNVLALLVRGADDAQRRAVIDGGEEARVAVVQYRVAVLDQRRAVLPDLLVGAHVVFGHAVRFVQDRRTDGVRRGEAVAAGDVHHVIDRPREVDRRGPCGLHHARRRDEIPQQGGHVRRGALAGGERHAVGRRDADRGRAAHDHICDRAGDFHVILVIDGLRLERDLALVDHAQTVVNPCHCSHRRVLKVLDEAIP